MSSCQAYPSTTELIFTAATRRSHEEIDVPRYVEATIGETAERAWCREMFLLGRDEE